MHGVNLAGARRALFLRLEGMHPAALRNRDGLDIFREMVGNRERHLPGRVIQEPVRFSPTCGLRPNIHRSN
jgi:hypothetical protein